MIVIGDVHGQFKALLELLDILPQTKDICFVGDLIDRGPKSEEVVKLVRDNNYACVLGNHEEMVNNKSYDLWMRNGGMQTMLSYGGDKEFLESDDIEWFKSLPLFAEYNTSDKKYLISHSYALDGEDTDPDDVLWGRDLWVNRDIDVISIFGHTPHKVATKIHDKHWCIDTGATFAGSLSAIDLTDEKIYSVNVEYNEMRL